ncbi:MAG: hypothetical protein AB2A00_01745 [Myxococcota bacterium]
MSTWLLITLSLALAEPPSDGPVEAPAPATTTPVVEKLTPQQRIEKADALLASLDDEAAREMVRPLVDDPTVSPRLRAQAGLRLGLAEVNLLRPEQAQQAFKGALGADPTLQLPVDASPKAHELFEAARLDLATSRTRPKALPEKPARQQEPALGWVRPTSLMLLASGFVLLGLGGAVAVGGVILREWTVRQPDPTSQAQYTRLLLPLALAAGGSIALSIPVAGTGLALFFLSGEEGPLRDKNPVDPDAP